MENELKNKMNYEIYYFKIRDKTLMKNMNKNNLLNSLGTFVSLLK